MKQDVIYKVCGIFGSYESQIYKLDEVLNLERGFLICVTRKSKKKQYDQYVVVPFKDSYEATEIDEEQASKFNFYVCTASDFESLLSCIRYHPHSVWFRKQHDGYLLATRHKIVGLSNETNI